MGWKLCECKNDVIKLTSSKASWKIDKVWNIIKKTLKYIIQEKLKQVSYSELIV